VEVPETNCTWSWFHPELGVLWVKHFPLCLSQLRLCLCQSFSLVEFP
jgi:hypothetical protein